MTMSAALATNWSCGPGCGLIRTASLAFISTVVRKVHLHLRLLQRRATRAGEFILTAVLELLRPVSLQQGHHEHVAVPPDGSDLLTLLEHRLQRASCCPAPRLILEAIHSHFNGFIPRSSEIRVSVVPVVSGAAVDLRFPCGRAHVGSARQFLQEGPFLGVTAYFPRV